MRALSVFYGPAAYFVDILQLLRRDGPPFTALMKRRPDLEHLKLTCENTNTPLPYVDLANEIMEFYVVHEKITKDAAKDTGDATAEELSVNPQRAVAQIRHFWRDQCLQKP